MAIIQDHLTMYHVSLQKQSLANPHLLVLHIREKATPREPRELIPAILRIRNHRQRSPDTSRTIGTIMMSLTMLKLKGRRGLQSASVQQKWWYARAGLVELKFDLQCKNGIWS